MKSARNIISWTLIVLGAVLLLFSIFWWTIAVKRLVLFPGDFEKTVECEGMAERYTMEHGLLQLRPPEKTPIALVRRLDSDQEECTTGTAVVKEEISQVSGAEAGLNLGEENVYVISRRDCMNQNDQRSMSSGVQVDRSGSWYVNFPLGTKQQSYNLFNNDVASSFAVNFVEEDEIDGVNVFIFEGSFRHRPMVDYRVRNLGLPETTTFGAIKEELEASGVPMEKMIRQAYGYLTPNERQVIAEYPDELEVRFEYTVKGYWRGRVEPVTGTVVDATFQERIFVNTEMSAFMPLFEVLANHSEDPVVEQYLPQLDQQEILEPKEIYRVRYGYTDESVEEMAEYAGGRLGPIRFIEDIVVLVMLSVGAALLIAGLVLRRERHHRAAEGVAPSGSDAGEEVKGDV